MIDLILFIATFIGGVVFGGIALMGIRIYCIYRYEQRSYKEN